MYIKRNNFFIIDFNFIPLLRVSQQKRLPEGLNKNKNNNKLADFLQLTKISVWQSG